MFKKIIKIKRGWYINKNMVLLYMYIYIIKIKLIDL